MAEYCNDECKQTGPICDFCKHYKDDKTDGEFQGEGFCEAKKIRVDAADACYDEFYCFNVDNNKNT